MINGSEVSRLSVAIHNMPVIAEQVAREQPEHLREYFMERVRHYRDQSVALPKPSDPRYVEMAEANKK
ncbi:DNA polymerase III subunit theta [Enterobacter sp. BIDMC100]|uniref:DNA polymerase III subunit theta n=1 Tax=Enterobacter sp. BIDMC100 TaxID=1686399 RepID=UPI00350E3E52